MNENFRRHGDIYKCKIYGSDVYVVSNPGYCDRILRWNWQNYPRQGQVVKRIALLLGNGLIASNGAFWASQRRMIQPAFSQKAVCAQGGLMAAVNAELLAAWTEAARRGETVNVTHDISCMVLKLTLQAIFGDDYEAAAPHFSILAEQPERNLEFALAFRRLGQVVRHIAAKRRRGEVTANDVLGRMMQARDREHGQPMTEAQLALEVMTLVVAGHETTAGLLTWLWYLLARHQDIQSTLSDEYDRLPWCPPWQGAPDTATLARYNFTRQVIDEALRLYPPLWLMTRKALNDDWLGAYFVPAGTEIYISPYLIQRSPALWDMPDRFDPDRMRPDHELGRHDVAHCPFGAGPRNCIGENFARVEMQIHLMMFARDLRLHYDDLTPPVMTTGMNLLSKNDFIMRPEVKPAGASSHVRQSGRYARQPAKRRPGDGAAAAARRAVAVFSS